MVNAWGIFSTKETAEIAFRYTLGPTALYGGSILFYYALGFVGRWRRRVFACLGCLLIAAGLGAITLPRYWQDDCHEYHECLYPSPLEHVVTGDVAGVVGTALGLVFQRIQLDTQPRSFLVNDDLYASLSSLGRLARFMALPSDDEPRAHDGPYRHAFRPCVEYCPPWEVALCVAFFLFAGYLFFCRSTESGAIACAVGLILCGGAMLLVGHEVRCPDDSNSQDDPPAKLYPQNPDTMSSDDLRRKAAELWERGNRHEDNDRAILANAAYDKANIAIAALNRKGLAFIPFTSADVCWCQPFDGPTHSLCPMHGTEARP